MRKVFFILSVLLVTGHWSLVTAMAANDKFIACGPGYILADGKQVDGIETAECQKLWCRDLEADKQMGTGDRAASGYKMTGSAVSLCDADGKCVECFGDRKWCSGEDGFWNPEYGAYTRGGGDTATYESFQRGDCFAWRLGQPECGAGETAILQNNEWICATASDAAPGVSRESAVRRTPTLRRLLPLR